MQHRHGPAHTGWLCRTACRAAACVHEHICSCLISVHLPFIKSLQVGHAYVLGRRLPAVLRRSLCAERCCTKGQSNSHAAEAKRPVHAQHKMTKLDAARHCGAALSSGRSAPRTHGGVYCDPDPALHDGGQQLRGSCAFPTLITHFLDGCAPQNTSAAVHVGCQPMFTAAL